MQKAVMDPENAYVSCIKIGRLRVIPPLLTEESRSEMRYYRDLAASLEKCRKIKRHSVDSGVIVSSSDGSIVKKSKTTSLNGDLKVNDSDQSPNTGDVAVKQNVEFLHGSTTPPKQRRNSYTVENPSPAMMEYIQLLKDNNQLTDRSGMNELFINSNAGNYSSLQPNTEISEVLILLEDFCDDMAADEKLTLEDLETHSITSESSKSTIHKWWNSCERRVSPCDMKRFAGHSEYSKAISLPGSCHASPICVLRACESSDCVKSNVETRTSSTDESGDSTPLANCSSQYNGFNDDEVFDLSRMETSPEKEQSYQYINDSFDKDFGLLDMNSSVNVSRESDTCRESVLSDCSSVSLSKFLSEKKSLDDKEAELAAFLLMKEQLEMKHRNELSRLLQEQQKEHDHLKEEFDRMSLSSKYTPSPKSSYAYSRDVVLKKYSPSECSSAPGGLRSSENYANESQSQTPRTLIKSVNSHREMHETEDKKMENLKEKFTATVRGYWTRRLFKTARVQLLVQTIKDCLVTAVSLQSESDLGLSELDLQNRLLQQLTVAFHELHDIFSSPLSEQLAIIATDREKKKRMRKITTPLPLSEATRRTLERRTSYNSAPPAQRKFTRKRCKSASSASSDVNSCRSTPGYRRPIARTIMSQKYSVSQCNRRPWR